MNTGEIKELWSTRNIIVDDFRREQSNDRNVIKALSDKQEATDKRCVSHNADFGKLISDLSHIYDMMKELKEDFKQIRKDINGGKP